MEQRADLELRATAISIAVTVLVLLILGFAIRNVSVGTPGAAVSKPSGASVNVLINMSQDIVAQLNLYILGYNGSVISSTAMNAATMNETGSIPYTFSNLTQYTSYIVRVTGTARPYCGTGVACAQYILEINRSSNVTTGAYGSTVGTSIAIP